MRNNGRAARFLRIWREDYIYQTLMSSAVSFGFTALFALYNGYLGLCYGSVWHGSIGIFYLLLMAIRGIVLLTEGRNRTRLAAERSGCRRRTFLISSILLLVLDLSLILPISMMAVLDKPVSIGLIPAIAMAAYTDGFDAFLRNTIQTADAFVYAFTISDHYTHSSFKCFDDRQFCNGHRTVTHGTPIAYLISGDYRYESNLRMIVEGRSEVGGNYLCGVATDEGNTAADVQNLADAVVFAMEKKLSRPANFYWVGGMKIFRDLIYVMRGMMKADHKFYKEHGIYDFPQKQKKRILQMKLVGAMLAVPSVQKKMKGQMNQYIIGPYQKVVEQARERTESTRESY